MYICSCFSVENEIERIAIFVVQKIKPDEVQVKQAVSWISHAGFEIMDKKKSFLVYISAIACLLACAGDFLTLFLLGRSYPGYSQLSDSISKLGTSESPVSGIFSAWWVIYGLLIMLFAFGFRKFFSDGNRFVSLAFWLLIIYGSGEGIATGLFRAEHLGDSLTLAGWIHDILGGIGLGAILVLPIVLKRVIPKSGNQGFHRLSNLTLWIGFLMWMLFSFRYLNSGRNAIAEYKGLWQRLFELDYYVYMIVIAVRMIRMPGLESTLISNGGTENN